MEQEVGETEQKEGEFIVRGIEERLLVKRRYDAYDSSERYECLKSSVPNGKKYSIEGLYSLLQETSSEKLEGREVIITNYRTYRQIVDDLEIHAHIKNKKPVEFSEDFDEDSGKMVFKKSVVRRLR